jgi:hypothetical protein
MLLHWCHESNPMNEENNIYVFIFFIALGEVKVDLTSFDVKLRKNVLCTLFLKVPRPPELSCKTLLTSYKTL